MVDITAQRGSHANRPGRMAGGAVTQAGLALLSSRVAANAIAEIICRTNASRAAFIEHCYEEALAIIEENKRWCSRSRRP
jgi:hypothetical protein